MQAQELTENTVRLALPPHIEEEREQAKPQPAGATAGVFGDLWGLTCSITAAYAAGMQQGDCHARF